MENNTRTPFVGLCLLVAVAVLLGQPSETEGFRSPTSRILQTHVATSTTPEMYHKHINDLKPIRKGPRVQSLIFNQRLDHFNRQDPRTFQQRYFVDDSFWTGQGPIFFYVGAETVTNEYSLSLISHYAAPMQGLMIAAEHRYYGESLPFGPKPSLEQLGWLSVEQALADYAVIVKHVKESLNATDFPVYCLGGSYGGILSAVLRMKYGNIFWGSVASAAPININNANPENWFAGVTETFYNYDENCTEIIHTGYQALGKLALSDSGRQYLSETLGLCFELETEAQAMEAIWWSMWAFSFVTEFNFPYPTGLYPEYPPLNYSCQLVRNSSDPVAAVGNVVKFAFNFTTNPVACFNSTSLFDFASAVLQIYAWHYEACAMIAVPVQSNAIDDMFIPFPWATVILPQTNATCMQLYNVSVNTEYVDTYLLGGDIRSYSRIMFTDGTFDPVRGYSPNQNISDSLISLTSVAAHTQDLWPPSPLDSPSLTALRGQVLSIFQEWTALYYATANKQEQ